MLREPPQAFLPRRGPQRRRSTLAALVVLVVLAIGFGRAGAESPDGGRPEPFGPTEGVPDAWIVTLNDYVNDPAGAGSRLVAIEREAGGELPPMMQVMIADAYLRSGNRRAAQRMFEQVLASDPGYPWVDFGNVGMGTVRMLAGDTDGAESYFSRLTQAEEGSSRALGNLGMGSALSADGRFEEARAAFDEVGTSMSVDEEVRQAGRFGSASALYGSGDLAGALAAFEAIAASDPDGPIGRDARFAAARVRLALGELDEGTAALRTITDACGDQEGARRAPRALRNLDPRAIGRTWVRNYRRTPFVKLQAEGTSLYSIDGCTLARATLRAVERGDPSLTGVQRISTGAAPEPANSETRPDERRAAEPATPAATSGTGWLPLLIAAFAIAAVAFFWLRRGRATS